MDGLIVGWDGTLGMLVLAFDSDKGNFVKLSFNEGVEIIKDKEDFRFVSNGKSPKEFRIII